MLEFLINYTSTQHFELYDPSDEVAAIRDFADFEIEVDAEVDGPPFDVRINKRSWPS